MDMKMEEDECNKMLDHLYQYVPHLEKLILQLKDPKRKNRELQLNKLEGLHSMITDRKKKIKLDTLKKCEDVILKILQKVNPNIYSYQTKSEPDSGNPIKFQCKDPPEKSEIASVASSVYKSDLTRFQQARAKLSEIATPASPSPPRDIPIKHAPIVIPTEKVNKNLPNPDDFQIKSWNKVFEKDNRRYESEKPNVYNQMGESLSQSSNKKVVFDRLGSKLNLSQPPLSVKDLELLTSPERDVHYDATHDLTMGELQDLRQVLQKKLLLSDEKFDLRDKLNQKEIENQYKEKAVKPVPPPPPLPNSKIKVPRVEKVFKNPDSKFGNLLSSIDDQILCDKKKDKKEHTKEGKERARSSDKESKKQSSRKDKEKKPHHHHRHEETKKEHKDKREKTEKYKSDMPKDKDIKPKTEDNTPEASRPDMKKPINHEFKDEKPLESLAAIAENKEPPTFKRLADKYNPRPRRNTLEKTPEFPNPTQSFRPPFKEPSQTSEIKLLEPPIKVTDPRLKSARVNSTFPENQFMDDTEKPQTIPTISPAIRSKTFPINSTAQNKVKMISGSMMRPNDPTAQNHFCQINQNPVHGGNSYMNTFIIQNNHNSNISSSSHQFTASSPPFNPPPKGFRPYDPIDNAEYDLSKMQPTDFYSPHFTKAKRPLLVTPGHTNRGSYSGQYHGREQRPFMGRPKNESWASDGKGHWREEQNIRPNLRDPRVRSRENKEKANYTVRRTSMEETAIHDSRYDALYVNLDREGEKDSFMSPLDSLYAAGEGVHKTGKGYGFQKFRIPKKKEATERRPSGEELEQPAKQVEKISEPKIIEVKSPPPEAAIETKIEEVPKVEVAAVKVDATEPIPLINEPKASLTEESIITNFFTSLIAKTEKKEILNALLNSIKDTVTDQERKNFKRIQKIMDSEEEDNIEEEKKSKDVETPKSAIDQNDAAKVEYGVVADLDANQEETATKETIALSSIDETISIQPIKKTRNQKRREAKKAAKKRKLLRIAAVKKTTKDDEDESVTETVGERIKNRRRHIKSPEVPKGRKCRTELDMLHEDIKEMFIRDGVLTATGKRMCRILKPDAEVENIKNLKSATVEDDNLLDSPKRRARTSNPKVLLEKSDFSKLTTKQHHTTDSDSDSEPLEKRLKKRTKPKNRESDTANMSMDSPLKRVVSKRATKSRPNYAENSEEDTPNHHESDESAQPNLEEDESTPPAVAEKKRFKRKKRGQNWASGVITKKIPRKKPSSIATTPTPSLEDDRPPTPISEPDDVSVQEDEEIEFIEPDIDYYFDPHDKADCKICPFRGKYIVQHYKTIHPKYEVMISRISPENAKNAIDDAVKKDYEHFELPPSESKFRRKRCTYQCRFCQMYFKNERFGLFYDHVSSHTGEYRFSCTICPFKTANSKSLRAHMHSSHNAKGEAVGAIHPSHDPPLEIRTVFGYLCGECNFVQIDRSIVETHVKIYHLGENINIYKINMSLSDNTSETQAEAVVPKINEETEPQAVEKAAPEKPEEALKKPEEAPEKPKETPETREEAPEKPEEAPAKPAEVAIPKPPEKPTEPPPATGDGTVFKYDPKYTKETIIHEEQKQEKMKEISSTIMPKKKLAFNFLNKIKSRLEDKVAEAAIEKAPDNSVSKEDAVVKNAIDVVCATEPIGNNAEAETKSKAEIRPSVIEKPIVNKNSEPITNIIERLQGKLSDIGQPPPLIPLNEFKIEPKVEDSAIHVGPVATTKKNGQSLYICYMQSCMYSSYSKSDFETHCTTLHNSEGCWDGYCSLCRCELESTRVLDAYRHLLNTHDTELNDDANGNFSKPYIRTRRLSGDKLSDLLNSTIVQNENGSFPFKIAAVSSAPAEVQEENHNFPFQICKVVSLADEGGENGNSDVITTATSSGTDLTPITLSIITANQDDSGLTGISSLDTARAIPIKNADGTECGFVVPILTSIAKEFISPTKMSPTKVSTLVPTSSKSPPNQQLRRVLTTSGPKMTAIKPPPKKIMLKDTPLTPEELMKTRKSLAAFKTLTTISKIVHLYKCPKRTCVYSTDTKKLFEAHISQHSEYAPGIQVPCLYCNFKTDFEFFAVHCDIRHGRCQFCCPYCFYRAINQSYVEMHLQKQHKGLPVRVLAIPVNQDALMSQAQLQLPHLQSIIPLYICGQLGCTKKFIIGDDYKDHLIKQHSSVNLNCFYCAKNPPTAKYAVVHYQSHNVYFFHCRYCSFAGNTADEIYKHLSLLHFANNPIIITRQFARGDSRVKQPDFNNEDPKNLELLQLITTESSMYINVTARQDVVPQPIDLSTTTITYKSPKSLGIARIKPANAGDQMDVTKNEDNKDAGETDVVQVLDDEEEEAKTQEVFTNPRPPSPIVLNKYLATSTERLKLSQLFPVPTIEKIDTDALDQPKSSDDDVITGVDDSMDPLRIDDPLDTSKTDSVQDSESKLEFSDDIELSDLVCEDVTFFADDHLKRAGLAGRNLFRCGFCKAGFETSAFFKTHVAKCTDINRSGVSKPFKCYHCVKSFKLLSTLMDHLRLHGTLRFACSICDFKHQHQLYVRSHLKSRHSITTVSITPIDPNKTCLDEDEFVVRPKMNRQKSLDSGNSSRDSMSSLDSSVSNKPLKKSYGPEDIDLLPLRPIFAHEIKCSACGYLTKVRANLIRHLQFHITGKEMAVPVTAPVNPVPCLEKNEKMFDKMTNLSLSSYKDTVRMASTPKVDRTEKQNLTKEEEAALPLYVPQTRRYVCGANYCDYLCLEESMLRYHLTALHSNESFYKCVHCNDKISTDKCFINVDFIIKHLRLHDAHLYKCGYCKFLHRQKHKVDRHILEKHTDQPHMLIIVREIEPVVEENQDLPEEIKEFKPWRCGMCKYRCANNEEMISHALKKHEVETQFKCALCQFRSNERSAFGPHFEKDHPVQSIDVIDAYYAVEETPSGKNAPEQTHAFDTTPLWQRDKNKLKHIRGIPIDESNKLKKSPMKLTAFSDNLEKSIEAVINAGLTTSNGNKGGTKKPKTLKEKIMVIKSTMENEIIDIVEPETKSKDVFDRRVSPLTVANVEEKFKDGIPELIITDKSESFDVEEEEEGVDELTLEEIETMDTEILRNSELTGTYGPFGKPTSKQFVCPLCSAFKTRKVEDITHHLYKELHYDRFVCTNCGLTGVTFSFLHKHSLKRHLTEAIHPISPNARIELWVRKVLTTQRRLMEENPAATNVTGTLADSSAKAPEKIELKNIQAAPVDEVISKNVNVIVEKATLPDSSTGAESETRSKGKQSPAVLHQCPHCSYTCRSLSDIRKHEKRHWVQKPLKCAYCDVEGVTKYEIFQHSKRAHLNMKPLAIPVPTPSTPTIIPITRKRKYPKDKPSAAEEATVEAIQPNVISDPLQPSDESISENESSYACNFCTKLATTEFDILTHCELMHKAQSAPVKFKKITPARTDKKQPVNYKCFYCDFIGTFQSALKHFQSKHPKLNFSVLRYKCGYCNTYFNNTDKIRAHWGQRHKGFEFLYTDVNNIPYSGSQLEYICEYCGGEFERRQELVDHHKSLHSHLELNLPPDLTVAPSIKTDNPKKIYKCPECAHTSHSYASMRDHLRGHAKPFECNYCLMRFTYPSVVKVHQAREHPNQEPSYRSLPEAVLLNDSLRKNLMTLNADGVYVKISTARSQKRPQSDQGSQPNKVRIVEEATTLKKVARKSTTTPPVKQAEGFSFYGNKPDLSGLENVKTTVDFMGSMVTMNIGQLGGFLNISPTVPLDDCKATDLDL